jgi:selenocysteine lyase/cysteine desulfurase
LAPRSSSSRDADVAEDGGDDGRGEARHYDLAAGERPVKGSVLAVVRALSGDPANLGSSSRECARRATTAGAEREASAATLLTATPPRRTVANGRAMTAVAASWLDTKQKMKSRGIVLCFFS